MSLTTQDSQTQYPSVRHLYKEFDSVFSQICVPEQESIVIEELN